MMRHVIGKSLVLGLVAIGVGCSTVRQARQAQEEARASVASAPDRPPVPLNGTLAELVDFALTNRPSVLSARLAVTDARLRMKEIAANAPVLSSTPWNAADFSVGGGYSESSVGEHLSDFDFTTKRGKSTGSLSLDLLVYDFGRNAAEARAQADRVIAAEMSLQEREYAVFREVVAGVASLREALSLRQVAETNAVAAAAHLEQVRLRESEGEAKKLDVLKAELTLAQAVESLVGASNDVVTAGANLVQAAGGGSLGLEDLGSGREIASERGHLVPVSSDDIIQLAETNAPAMQVARARARAASADVDRAIADLYPTLSASASLSWTDPLWYLRWGVNAAQSLFTGFRKTTAVDRSVVALQSAVATVNETSLNVRHDLDLALAARENAAEMLRTATDTRRTAEENFALVDEQYRIGEANRVDYADALKAVAEARGTQAKAEAAALRAEATIYQVLGLAPNYFN